MYKERKAAGIPEEQIMESIYQRGRDNARTPMQWDSSPQAGFTTGTPWLPVNPNYTEINAENRLADPNSVFYTYATLIRLRKQYEVFVKGDFTLLEKDHPHLFVYQRHYQHENLLVVCNFGGTATEWSLPPYWHGATCLVQNYQDTPVNGLRPWEARIYFKNEVN